MNDEAEVVPSNQKEKYGNDEWVAEPIRAGAISRTESKHKANDVYHPEKKSHRHSEILRALYTPFQSFLPPTCVVDLKVVEYEDEPGV